jgi:hypothetical protein
MNKFTYYNKVEPVLIAAGIIFLLWVVNNIGPIC